MAPRRTRKWLWVGLSDVIKVYQSVSQWTMSKCFLKVYNINWYNDIYYTQVILSFAIFVIKVLPQFLLVYIGLNIFFSWLLFTFHWICWIFLLFLSDVVTILWTSLRVYTQFQLLRRLITGHVEMMNGCQQLAVESLTTSCKCHGVSGSCSMRTCWKSLPDLRSVAVTLLDRYSFAVAVTYRRISRRRSRQPVDAAAVTTTSPINAVNTPPSKRLVPVLRRRRTLNDTDIVYYTMSPDYCLPDASLGSIGTKDRYRH